MGTLDPTYSMTLITICFNWLVSCFPWKEQPEELLPLGHLLACNVALDNSKKPLKSDVNGIMQLHNCTLLRKFAKLVM